MANSVKDERKYGRFSIYVYVDCTFRDGGSERIRVRNLSEHGLGGQMEGDRPLEPGVPITLSFRGTGPVEGRIAWAEGRNIGVAFDNPVEPSAVLPQLAHRGKNQ